MPASTTGRPVKAMTEKEFQAIRDWARHEFQMNDQQHQRLQILVEHTMQLRMALAMMGVRKDHGGCPCHPNWSEEKGWWIHNPSCHIFQINELLGGIDAPDPLGTISVTVVSTEVR